MDALQDPQYKTADGSALRIWRDTAQNNFLTEQEGRVIFDEVIYVEVISPGSRDSTPVFEVERIFAAEMHHAPMKSAQYATYKDFITDFEKNEEGTGDATMAGTPLKEWPQMSRMMAATLKAQNIFTVEALANLPDQKLIVVGPDGRTWRESAKAYLENAKGGAYATALAADLEAEKVKSADLQDQIKELAAQVEKLQNASGSGAAKPGKASVATTEDPTATEKPPGDII